MAADAYSSPKTTLYRIGDFAKYLGVTPDFLKHYERLGIISSEQGENGYRYFRFQESNRIFECLKMKNLGFTIRESEQIIKEMSEAEIMEKTRANIELIKKDVEFKQTLLDTFSRFEEEMSFLAYADSDWTISSAESLLFLPHTRSREFINDPRIYEILPAWMRIIPIVRSGALLPPDRPEDYTSPSWKIKRTWGMVAPKKLIERLGVPVNDAVIELPPCKALQYSFSARIPQTEIPDNFYKVWKKLDELNMKPGGDIIMLNNIGAHEQGRLGVNQRYIVPLQGIR